MLQHTAPCWPGPMAGVRGQAARIGTMAPGQEFITASGRTGRVMRQYLESPRRRGSTDVVMEPIGAGIGVDLMLHPGVVVTELC